MPPQDNNKIAHAVSIAKVDFERTLQEAIRSHRHDGDFAQQINYPDIFDLPIQYLQAQVVEPATDTAVVSGQHFFHIPKGMDGLRLVEVHAEVATAGATNTLDIQIPNSTQGVDMLSTVITIDSGDEGSDEAATPPVINTSNNLIVENDVVRVDVDAVHTTPAKGLVITLGFQ